MINILNKQKKSSNFKVMFVLEFTSSAKGEDEGRGGGGGRGGDDS
jgi:hypothetical protein